MAVLKDRITEFDGIKNNTLIKTKSIKQINKVMKYIRIRCEIGKNDIQKTSYARRLKSRKHLENITKK